MRIYRLFSSLSVSGLCRFLGCFVPIYVVIMFLHVWMEQKTRLQSQTHVFLADASTHPNPPISADTKVVKFLKKYPVYLSLTTIPERIRYVPEVLSVLDLTHVSRVFVNIPQQCVRSSHAYDIPEQLSAMPKVTIRRVMSDYGPITKLLPTLTALQDKALEALIVVIDDDMIYPRGLVNQHIHALAHHPGLVSATMPGQLTARNANPPHSYQLDARAWLRKPKSLQAIVQGVGSYAFINTNIDYTWLNSMVQSRLGQQHDPCLMSDDLLVSYALSRKGTRPYLLQNNAFSYAALVDHPLASRCLPLHQSSYGIRAWLLAEKKRLFWTQQRMNHCLHSF